MFRSTSNNNNLNDNNKFKSSPIHHQSRSHEDGPTHTSLITPNFRKFSGFNWDIDSQAGDLIMSMDIPDPDATETISSPCNFLAPSAEVSYSGEIDGSTIHFKIFEELSFTLPESIKNDPQALVIRFDKFFKLNPNLFDALSRCQPQIRNGVELLKKNSDHWLQALKGPLQLIVKAWALPKIGRDLATELCDSLRAEGGMELLLELFCDCNRPLEIRYHAARVFSQSLTINNRNYIAKNYLHKIIDFANKAKLILDLCRLATLILQNLCKVLDNSSLFSLIKDGGLDVIIFCCRSNDSSILKNCSMALANLVLYANKESHQELIDRKVEIWLFPLAFSNDDCTRYYALMAIAGLSANKDIEEAVNKSQAIELVEPFLRSHDPVNFAKVDPELIQGSSNEWLKQLVPLLTSKREEAQALAAFHFAMEAGIKRESKQLKVFKNIGVIKPLKKLVCCASNLATKFACHALRIIGESLPRKLSQRVLYWTPEDISCWLHQSGIEEDIVRSIEACRIDGDLLLQITEENLKDDLKIENGLSRKRFLRVVNELKQNADYSSIDPTRLGEWLGQLSIEFRQYTYQMLKSHVDLHNLSKLTDEHLQQDCGINNGIHRLLILEAATNASQDFYLPITTDHLQRNTIKSPDQDIDIFISYRRRNGSMLACLLKVYLQLQGFSVYLDVDKLPIAEMFDVNLLQSIGRSRNFILVLTEGCLDRCVSDTECKDWIHREISHAMKSGCNIIPVIDAGFVPPNEETLPEDVRRALHYHGVPWVHTLQEGCVAKLCDFLRGKSPVTPPTARIIATKPKLLNHLSRP